MKATCSTSQPNVRCAASLLFVYESGRRRTASNASMNDIMMAAAGRDPRRLPEVGTRPYLLVTAATVALRHRISGILPVLALRCTVLPGSEVC